jgi:hypothetical protein
MTKYLALFLLGCFMILIGINLPALPQYPAIEWGRFILVMTGGYYFVRALLVFRSKRYK